MAKLSVNDMETKWSRAVPKIIEFMKKENVDCQQDLMLGKRTYFSQNPG